MGLPLPRFTPYGPSYPDVNSISLGSADSLLGLKQPSGRRQHFGSLGNVEFRRSLHYTWRWLYVKLAANCPTKYVFRATLLIGICCTSNVFRRCSFLICRSVSFFCFFSIFIFRHSNWLFRLILGLHHANAQLLLCNPDRLLSSHVIAAALSETLQSNLLWANRCFSCFARAKV